jgi:hypothetical protein
MNKLSLTELDTIFISYDEPNADKNYSELLQIIPWAKRIHGVKGSDAAHKAAANLSETDRFISIDADNIIDPKFFAQEIEITDQNKDFVFSWCGRNAVNGLVYGNGGVKCWTKDFVLNMKTHENSAPGDIKNEVEFCFDPRYFQMNDCFSTSYINGSPKQAFRAGFREGVKMCLAEGTKVQKIRFRESLYWKNYHRLLIWMNVGADVKNGLWAIYGARLGCQMTNLTDWDYLNVRDFEYLNELWNFDISLKYNDNNIMEAIESIGKELLFQLDLPVSIFDADQSRFFKTVYSNPIRIG